MIIQMTVTLRAPWVRSLKDKRSIVKSLMAKLRAKFNLTVAETGLQDVHQTVVVTVASLVPDTAAAHSTMDNVMRFIETATDAVVTGEERVLL